MILIILFSEECRIFQVKKKRDLSNNYNEGEASKKPWEPSLNTSISSDVPDDLFTESMKDPECVTI